MKPEATMHGIATSPTNPSLHSARKAITSPPTIAEKFIKTVETNDVTKLLTCLESTPNLVAASPPLFSFRSNHETCSLSILLYTSFLIFSVTDSPTRVNKMAWIMKGKKIKTANRNRPRMYFSISSSPDVTKALSVFTLEIW